MGLEQNLLVEDAHIADLLLLQRGTDLYAVTPAQARKIAGERWKAKKEEEKNMNNSAVPDPATYAVRAQPPNSDLHKNLPRCTRKYASRESQDKINLSSFKL